jgi:isopentenyldiphosphate isomerase
MLDDGIFENLKEFSKKLPKFEDGRIDYRNSAKAPVVTVFVKYNNKILLLKRSSNVNDYPRKWNAVTGFMDELIAVEEKILQELNEELGIGKDSINSIRVGKPYEVKDSDINKIWIVNPAIVELSKVPEIKLNFEHTDFKWIRKEELNFFNTVPILKNFFENYTHMKTIVFGV